MRLANNVSTPTLNESKFVRNGKANIEVRLSVKNAAVLDKLRAAGFENLSEQGDSVSGKIAIEKLSALADIGEVKLVLPKL
jgi:hypothetical protein